jgi:hypothetical protein
MGFRWMLLTVSLALPVLGFAAGPNELRYSFVDIGLAGGEVEVIDEDLDFGAAGVTGSSGVHPNIALFGRLGVTVVDTSSSFFDDVETSELSLGINPHFALSDSVHIVIPIAFEWAEVDDGFFTDDDTGYSIGVGVRALLNPSLELAGGVQHVDIFGSDDQSISGSIRWHISRLFSLSAGAAASDDVTAVNIGARFSF